MQIQLRKKMMIIKIIKKINEEKFNNKLKYGEKIRNEQIINGYIETVKDKEKKKEANENINSTELPKIPPPLFTQNEKKVLGNIIPEKEIKKYEKRYEFLDKEKNNLLRKHAFETKKLEKEKADLEKKFNLGNNQLAENQNKNKKLEKQISDQEKELAKLQDKLESMKYELDQKKMELKAKEEENKKLKDNLKNIKNNKFDEDLNEEKPEEEENEEGKENNNSNNEQYENDENDNENENENVNENENENENEEGYMVADGEEMDGEEGGYEDQNDDNN